MFVGGLPKETLLQVARVFPLAQHEEIYICCSGSFRLEQLIHQVAPHARVVGNDVSLLTCSIGDLAATNAVFPFTFVEQLAFMEELLPSAAEAATPVDPPNVNAAARKRIAAILVAGEMSRYPGRSEFDATHRDHYRNHFVAYLDKGVEKLARLLDAFRMHAFIPRDFRAHASEAAERGAAVLGFPPTYKGGYENLYKFLSKNITWAQPSYDVFDPRTVESWVASLHAAGASYCVGSDQRFKTMDPAASFSPSGKHTIFVYTNTGRSAFDASDYRMELFRYEPVIAEELTAETPVSIVPADAAQMRFLKERYLSRNIVHTDGQLNFLVYLGGRLAGGFIYQKSKYDPLYSLYLLSDFSVSRERRISKLIAMLATCHLPIGEAERRMLIRVRSVTTAFTQRPVSMKYRGIFELTGRGPGHLQYASHVREASPQEIYREWFQRHAGAAERAGDGTDG